VTVPVGALPTLPCTANGFVVVSTRTVRLNCVLALALAGPLIAGNVEACAMVSAKGLAFDELG
jgi:hypothetical protein